MQFPSFLYVLGRISIDSRIRLMQPNIELSRMVDSNTATNVWTVNCRY